LEEASSRVARRKSSREKGYLLHQGYVSNLKDGTSGEETNNRSPYQKRGKKNCFRPFLKYLTFIFLARPITSRKEGRGRQGLRKSPIFYKTGDPSLSGKMASLKISQHRGGQASEENWQERRSDVV